MCETGRFWMDEQSKFVAGLSREYSRREVDQVLAHRNGMRVRVFRCVFDFEIHRRQFSLAI